MLLVRYVYYPCAIVLACLVIAYSQQAAHLMQLASQAHSLQGATELALKSLLETWSFSLYSGAEDMRGEYGEIVARANFQSKKSRIVMCAVVVIVLPAVTVMAPRIPEAVDAIAATAKTIGKWGRINIRSGYSRIKIAWCDDRSVAPSVPVGALESSTA